MREGLSDSVCNISEVLNYSAIPNGQDVIQGRAIGNRAKGRAHQVRDINAGSCCCGWHTHAPGPSARGFYRPCDECYSRLIIFVAPPSPSFRARRVRALVARFEPHRWVLPGRGRGEWRRAWDAIDVRVYMCY